MLPGWTKKKKRAGEENIKKNRSKMEYVWRNIQGEENDQ